MSSQKEFLIVARAGDPAMKEGRARLIWAANTAEAIGRLGHPAVLCSKGTHTWDIRRWLRPFRPKRVTPDLCNFYNLEGKFRVANLPLPKPVALASKAYKESGRFEVSFYYRRHVLPAVGAVHTRDWRIVKAAVARGIPTIFEDHSESFNEEMMYYDARVVYNPAFRVAVAISPWVKEIMLQKGMPVDKLLVEQSGLNVRSVERAGAEEISQVRNRLLGDRRCFDQIAAYTGGLHPFRGIGMLLKTARKMPRVKFIVAGGRGRQVKEWKEKLKAEGVGNVELVGYLPQSQIPSLLQAADALLLPYEDSAVSKVTSPLKFFEYLAAGRPIAACRIPAIDSFRKMRELKIWWSAIGEADEFTAATQAALASSAACTFEHSHSELASKYTWVEREKRILSWL